MDGADGKHCKQDRCNQQSIKKGNDWIVIKDDPKKRNKAAMGNTESCGH